MKRSQFQRRSCGTFAASVSQTTGPYFSVSSVNGPTFSAAASTAQSVSLCEEVETPAEYSGSKPKTQGFDVSTLTRTAFMSGQP